MKCRTPSLTMSMNVRHSIFSGPTRDTEAHHAPRYPAQITSAHTLNEGSTPQKSFPWHRLERSAQHPRAAEEVSACAIVCFSGAGEGADSGESSSGEFRPGGRLSRAKRRRRMGRRKRNSGLAQRRGPYGRAGAGTAGDALQDRVLADTSADGVRADGGRPPPRLHRALARPPVPSPGRLWLLSA